MAYTVKVGGQTVQAIAGTLDFTNEIGQRSQGQFSCWTPTGVSYAYGTQLQVYNDSGAFVYGGFVDTDKATKPGWSALLQHDITCMDYHYCADKRLAFQSFLNATAGSIVSALWSAYLQAEGVTLGPIAAGLQIPEVIWNGEQVSTCLDWLAQQCGYWWQIDQNKVLWFQPYGGTPAPFTLDGTQVSQDDKLVVTFGNRKYRNRQFLVGGKDRTAVHTETLIGDGVRRAFTLRYPVASVTGTTKGTQKGVWVDGVQKTLANKTTGSGAQWYYAISDAVLAQDPSEPVLGTGDTLTVTYEGEYPVVALAQNAALIAQQRQLEGGGTGYVEVKESNTKVHTLAAGFQIAQAELAHFGQSMTTLVWASPANSAVAGITQGQLLTVALADFGLNEQMLVRSVEITDNIDSQNIWYVVTCIGSPYDVTWQTFFQNLLNTAGAGDTSSDPANQGEGAILAALGQIQLVRTPSVIRITTSKSLCPIIGPATLCGPNTIVC